MLWGLYIELAKSTCGYTSDISGQKTGLSEVPISVICSLTFSVFYSFLSNITFMELSLCF